MSAIAGIYYSDGRPVDSAELERMLASLAHRGPNGASAWSKGPVGLGHRMLYTTPESLREKLPLVDNNGDVVLTADARIDNRDELIPTLGMTDRRPGEIADSQLILAAYGKWGEMCPEHLLGDFAFAIWDERKQSLFCARDHMGVKPFYYHHSGQSFIFASEIKAILSQPQVPRRLNEVRVAEYLASMFDDKTITFYKDILRLPPAHTLTVSRKGMQLRSYWSLDSSRELRLGSDEEYAEAFRELFTEAVRCRLRSAFPVACSLSGGLDSSSVSCVAEHLFAQNGGSRLRTFSIVFDELRQCDERPFIEKVLCKSGFEPRYINGDRMSPLENVERILWHEDEPFYAPGLYSTWELYRTANAQGIRVLLDGHDGDGTVSHGAGRLDELAEAGRWIALVVEARGLAKVHEQSSRKLVWRYVRRCKLDPIIARSSIFKRMQRLSRALGRRFGTRKPSFDQPAWKSIVNSEFATRVHLPERYRSWSRDQPGAAWGERQTHYRILSAGLQPFALEVLDKAVAAFGIELRHPFCDKRLVEFCLALPSDQKLNWGWSRLVLRRAMAGLLPGKVQWRVNKTDFLPRFSFGLLVQERERLATIVRSDLDFINDYVNVSAFLYLYEGLLRQPSQVRLHEVLTFWRAVSLALWLRYSGEKGGV